MSAIGPIVGLGGSAGSLKAILEICSQLDPEVSATILIANHLPYGSHSNLDELIPFLF